jgi:transposase
MPGILIRSLAQVLSQRHKIAAEVERILDAHPIAKVRISMLGVGVRTAARILLEVGDGSAFPTSGHLAAHAGLAPRTRESGTQSTASRAYYDRKRAARKRHNAALICLACRRVDGLFAMMRDRRPYHPRPVHTA